MAGESFLGTCSIHPGRRHQTRLQQSRICNSDRLSEIGWDDLAGSVGTGFFVLWLKTLSMTKHHKPVIKGKKKNVFLGQKRYLPAGCQATDPDQEMTICHFCMD